MVERLKAPDQIYYEDVLDFILTESCTSCHNKSDLKAEVDVSSYEATLGVNSKRSVVPFDPAKSTLYQTLILKSGSRKMPPLDKPQLSENQINLVFQWINNGAKKKGAKVPARPKALSEQLAPYFESPEKVDYKVINDLVFKKNCLDCHSDQGSKSDQDGAILYGQNMTDYKSLFMDNGIVPERLTDYVISVDGKLRKKKGSRIYKSMAINQTMPPAGDGYLPVDSLYIKLVRLWIENCAIEDYEAIKDNDDLIDDEDSISKVRNCK